jgi:hypothetical protein
VRTELSPKGQPAISSGQDQKVDARQWPTSLPSDFHAERDAVIRAHHNLLLVGTPSATNEMLFAMKPYLRQPLHQYRSTMGVPVPQPSEGTLILLEVAELDSTEQTELLRWLDQFQQRLPVQVVSTTCKPLFSLVESGAFSSALYYRLNVVRIDLT